MKIERETFSIPMKIGSGFLKRIFGGKSFMHCVIELIKNALDWNTTKIYIFTEDKNIFRILDNGDGMNAENRSAFSSLNTTTALDPKQSGLFCTGSKKMLFSHSEKVVVMTAPKDDSTHVYMFEITVGEYERKILESETIKCQRVPKSANTWPHDFPFGTELRYTLSDSKSRSILRGAHLANELSDRLSLMFSGIVFVDKESIPRKEIIGEEVQLVFNKNKRLGPVSVLLYSPKHPRAEDELRFTSSSIGEIPVRNFMKAAGEFRSRMPEVYLLPAVCGVISANFLKDHANEDRDTLSPGLADDQRLQDLFSFLDILTEETCQKLKITLKHETAQDNAQEQLLEVCDFFNRHYNPGNLTPIGGDEPVGPPLSPSHPTNPRVLTLSSKDEFEIGELIEITPTINTDLRLMYDPADVIWNFDESKAKMIGRLENGTVQLRATEIGNEVVKATLKNNPCRAVASYEIVVERKLRLRNTHMKARLGSDLTVFAVNLDKLKGKLKWTHEGVGKLNADGGRGVFSATSLGSAFITVYDSADMKTATRCEITVFGKPPKLLTIRDFHFHVGTFSSGAATTKPIEMTRGDEYHHLWLSSSAPALIKARERKNLRNFLAHAISTEFAYFSRFVLGEENLEDLDPRDIATITSEIVNTGWEILYEAGFTE